MLAGQEEEDRSLDNSPHLKNKRETGSSTTFTKDF